MKKIDQEPRKLIRFGNSSYIIALPKHWIVKHKLKKGDVVYLSENENSELLVNINISKKTASKGPIRVNIDNKTNLGIQREITSAYINNYEEIVLEGKLLSNKKEYINRLVSEKAGIEITEESKERVIIRDIFDFESVSFERIVRRMDNIIRSMFEEMTIGLKSSSFKEWYLREITKADKGANKMYFLILKIIRRCQEDMNLMRKLKVDNKMLTDASWFAFQSEQLGDDIKRVAKLLTQINLNDEEKEKVSEIISELEKEYQVAMNAYYTRNKVTAQELANRYDSYIIKCDKYLGNSPTPLMGNLNERVKGIFLSILTIAKIMAY